MPDQPQRQLVTVVNRLDPEPIHGRREPARLLDDLAHQRDVKPLDLVPERVTRGRWHLAFDLCGRDHFSHHGRLGRRQTAHVLGYVPELLFGHEFRVEQVGERRHRRAIQTGAQSPVDVFDRAAAIEIPVLAQVRWSRREVQVILQRG